MEITPAAKADYDELTEVWEASVRATHHFVAEEDILYFRTLVSSYFDAVDLYLIRDGDKITGFLGVADYEVQMLFLHPGFRGKGLGKLLMQYAIAEHQVKKVEVNEQNHQALSFYQHLGFKVVARRDTDYSGRPYPILSMVLD
ncbi:MAG: GNAT family N-acetyltransferase [Mucilaginibacter sp.]